MSKMIKLVGRVLKIDTEDIYSEVIVPEEKAELFRVLTEEEYQEYINKEEDNGN